MAGLNHQVPGGLVPCIARSPQSSAERSVLSPRGLTGRFVPMIGPAMIDGDGRSKSRSRLICVRKLGGNSGSGFNDVRNLSPISRTMARLCLWSMSMRLCIAKLPIRKPGETLRSRGEDPVAVLNGTGDRRFWLSARAIVLKQPRQPHKNSSEKRPEPSDGPDARPRRTAVLSTLPDQTGL